MKSDLIYNALKKVLSPIDFVLYSIVFDKCKEHGYSDDEAASAGMAEINSTNDIINGFMTTTVINGYTVNKIGY